jgi:hypothetical protein
MLMSTIRSLPFGSMQFVVVALVSAAFLGLGITGVIAPRVTGALFGADPGGSFAFVQAVGARNTGLSLLAIALLVLDQRLALVALLAAAAIVAALDLWIVSTATSFVHAIKHLGYTLAMATLAGWLYFGSRP